MENNTMGISIKAPKDSVAETAKNPEIPAPQQPPADTMATKPINTYIPEPTLPASAYQKQVQTMMNDNVAITEDTLRQDAHFIEASRNILKFRGEDLEGLDDAQIVNMGLDYIGQVNYNIPSAVSASLDYNDADELTVASMGYMMQAYDQKDMSWAEGGQIIEGFAKDPSTYFSVVSLGMTAPAVAAAKMTATQAFKKFILNKMVLASVEAGTYAGAATALKQDTEIDTKIRKDYSYGEIGGAVALGLAFPKVLQKTGQGVVKGYDGVMNKLYDDIEQYAGGGKDAAKVDAFLKNLDPVKEGETLFTAGSK